MVYRLLPLDKMHEQLMTSEKRRICTSGNEPPKFLSNKKLSALIYKTDISSYYTFNHILYNNKQETMQPIRDMGY